MLLESFADLTVMKVRKQQNRMETKYQRSMCQTGTNAPFRIVLGLGDTRLDEELFRKTINSISIDKSL